MGAAFGGNQEQGNTLLRSSCEEGEEREEMLRRRSSNVYCPHNGVLCREEDLTLSAVCSTFAQDLPHTSNTPNKDKIDSSASSTSSMKLKSKRVVFVVPPLSEPEHHAVLAEE